MSTANHFQFKSDEGTRIHVYNWLPASDIQVKGVVQICHGMAETAARYERFALELNRNGYIVYIHDQRGHGKTAKVLENVGYLADRDGFEWMVHDLYKLTGIIKKKHPELPLFLMGHSMGSFVTQRYLMLYGEELDGVILSGSTLHVRFILHAAALLTKEEIRRRGRRVPSHRMNKLSFGGYNNAFKPVRTEFDWLSRDAEEVDKYIRDPFCGTVFTTGFFADFFTGLKQLGIKNNLNLVRKDLPIHIFAGDKDPVGSFGKGIIRLYNAYKQQGIDNVTYKLYPGGRHEMLNETNRDEVTADIVNWLDERMSKKV
ncbi:alpha/beta hydrolase [Paenibacillus xylanexedens]|uniref:alpha/beta hydrolase n=1 Tax=Paenibacillus xylanexedens TaxID=528191 RepID=UPI0011A85341|nr:alpha/beta hydrolase [Paenibacillus xylanexedens]